MRLATVSVCGAVLAVLLSVEPMWPLRSAQAAALDSGGAAPGGAAPGGAAPGSSAPAPGGTASTPSVGPERPDLRVSRYPKHIDEKTEKAIEAGLKWLADNQRADGSWAGVANAYGGDFPVAMTGLAGLAFLAHGDTPERGTYAPNVKAAMNYLLRIKTEDGLITSGAGEGQRPIYGHCFSVLFLAELYGMEVDEITAAKIRKRLEDGVRVIATAQSARGGWYYTVESGKAGQDEGSVTITAVQALRAAKNAGIPVDKKLIERGIQYILLCQSPIDGGIRYSYRLHGPSRPAITAAAVATLYSAGVYEKSEDELAELQKLGELTELERRSLEGIKRCLKYCDEVFARRVDPGMVQGFMFYTHLYLAQAMWSSGDKRWDAYFPRIREWLIDDIRSRRQDDGSWLGDEPGPGKVYGTAVACLVLQIPYQHLPIWQR